MAIRTDTAPNTLVQIRSREVVVEQLKNVYIAEIHLILEELDKLLPSYRTLVDSRTYERAREKIMLMTAWVADKAMSVHALATSLDYLVEQQSSLTTALREGSPTDYGAD